MINKIKLIAKNPLFSGSAIMVVGTNVFNAGQLLYQVIVIRLIETSLYGDFAAIISILGIIGVIQVAFGLTIVKFVASQENDKEISNIVKWFNYWGFIGGGIAAVLMLILSPFVGKFLNLTEPKILLLLSPILLLFVLVYIYRSILLGMLAFRTYVISLIVEVGVKILATAVLVYLGGALFGAMIGVLMGVIFGLLLARFSIAKYLKGSRGKIPEVVPLLKYSLPAFVQNLAFTSMFSIDIFLVKHFFSAEQAGTYAYLSVLGRIAMYCSTPITQTMFPIIAKKHAHKENYTGVFYLSVVFVLTISILVVLFFALFPGFLLSLLGKTQGGEVLWWFGLTMTLLGVSLVLIQFYLSINETKPVWFFVAAALLQAGLIWFIHPTLLSVVQMSIVSTSLLVIALLVYFPYRRHGKV